MQLLSVYLFSCETCLDTACVRQNYLCSAIDVHDDVQCAASMRVHRLKAQFGTIQYVIKQKKTEWGVVNADGTLHRTGWF